MTGRAFASRFCSGAVRVALISRATVWASSLWMTRMSSMVLSNTPAPHTFPFGRFDESGVELQFVTHMHEGRLHDCADAS